MKRINFAEDIKVTAVSPRENTFRGCANGSRGNKWYVTVTRGDKSCTFPYSRGRGLSYGSCIDTVAALKATMMNMAVLAILPTKLEMGDALDITISDQVYDNMVRLQAMLRDVLGNEEFDRIVNIILSNAQETAGAI